MIHAFIRTWYYRIKLIIENKLLYICLHLRRDKKKLKEANIIIYTKILKYDKNFNITI